MEESVMSFVNGIANGYVAIAVFVCIVLACSVLWGIATAFYAGSVSEFGDGGELDDIYPYFCWILAGLWAMVFCLHRITATAFVAPWFLLMIGLALFGVVWPILRCKNETTFVEFVTLKWR